MKKILYGLVAAVFCVVAHAGEETDLGTQDKKAIIKLAKGPHSFPSGSYNSFRINTKNANGCFVDGEKTGWRVRSISGFFQKNAFVEDATIEKLQTALKQAFHNVQQYPGKKPFCDDLKRVSRISLRTFVYSQQLESFSENISAEKANYSVPEFTKDMTLADAMYRLIAQYVSFEFTKLLKTEEYSDLIQEKK